MLVAVEADLPALRLRFDDSLLPSVCRESEQAESSRAVLSQSAIADGRFMVTIRWVGINAGRECFTTVSLTHRNHISSNRTQCETAAISISRWALAHGSRRASSEATGR